MALLNMIALNVVIILICNQLMTKWECVYVTNISKEMMLVSVPHNRNTLLAITHVVLVLAQKVLCVFLAQIQ